MSQNCLQKFSKKDFFRLVREAVKFSPIPDGKINDVFCKRLNSFIVTSEVEDFTLDNFGIDQKKHRGKMFSFQRGNKAKFPAVIVSEVDGYIEHKKECCSFQIGVIDKHITDCKNCGYCNKRTEEEIYCDLRELLLSVFRYLQSVEAARPYKINNENQREYLHESYQWYSESVLNYMRTKGTIDGYESQFASTRKLQRYFKLVDRIKMERTTYLGGYYALFVEPVTICTNLECAEYDWNVKAEEIKIDCC